MHKTEEPLIDLEVSDDNCDDETQLKITMTPVWTEKYGWPFQIGEGKDAIKIPDFFKKKRYRSVALIHVIYWHEFKKTKFPFKYLRAFEEYSIDERLQILKTNQQKLNSEEGEDCTQTRVMGALYIAHIQKSLENSI